MKVQPAYFEPIRLRAARRWDQLENDPELAGPWHQLFRQVQTPRHVLSELLQNADDAGATEASVRIENQVFVFEHNGEDFTEDHLGSLCRFGYSNKRALHTIGFRGIGFKSTFSLGDQVELFTPTLAISFHRRRFTEPCWLPDESETTGMTRIRVGMSDLHRQRDVQKNLEEWLTSPVSMLFFKSIRRLQIGGRVVHWVSLRPGPVPDSEWMALSETQDDSVLLLRSQAEAFPEEALTEVKQERMLGAEDNTDFPPCKIEIVLGAKGRLFVVLPTGVETELTFALNAPFIQDPSRLKIKEPATSPTNRWLLERAGRLAASAMVGWLGQSRLSLAERAAAYRLFPDVSRDDNSLEGVCATLVEKALGTSIEGQPVLLTDDGELTRRKGSIAIPEAVFSIWSGQQAAALLDTEGRPALCRNIKPDDRKKLLRWGIVEEIDKKRFLGILQSKHLPTPETWHQLLRLWAYIAPEIAGYGGGINSKSFCIMPVQGKSVLHAAANVVRLTDKKILQSQEDWEFLAAYLSVLDQDWVRFLAEQRQAAPDQKDVPTRESVEKAYAVLERVGLGEASNVDTVIDRVAEQVFAQNGLSLNACVHFTQIAAKLGTTVGKYFRYATRDRQFRSACDNILFDTDGRLEELVPEELRETQMLHHGYTAEFSSCSREEWQRWISSGHAGLCTFVPLARKKAAVSGEERTEAIARKRGLKGGLSLPYRTSDFVFEDWDFDIAYWRYWNGLALSDDHLWIRITDRLFSQRDAYWGRTRRSVCSRSPEMGTRSRSPPKPCCPCG